MSKNPFTNHSQSYSNFSASQEAPILGQTRTIEGFDDNDYKIVQTDGASDEYEIIVKASDADEAAAPAAGVNTHQYLSVLQADDFHFDHSHHIPTDIPRKDAAPVQEKPQTPPNTPTQNGDEKIDTSEWGMMTNVYIGSLAVIGLFVLFRALQK